MRSQCNAGSETLLLTLCDLDVKLYFCLLTGLCKAWSRGSGGRGQILDQLPGRLQVHTSSVSFVTVLWIRTDFVRIPDPDPGPPFHLDPDLDPNRILMHSDPDPKLSEIESFTFLLNCHF